MRGRSSSSPLSKAVVVVLILLLHVAHLADGYRSVMSAPRVLRSRRSLSELHAVANEAWSSAISTLDNLDEAIEEAIAAACKTSDPTFDVAFFFVSSIYEASAYQYSSIFSALQSRFPTIKHIVGCTTGAVVGPLQRLQEPLEVEARSSISITLAKLDSSLGASTLVMTPEQIAAYIAGGPAPDALSTTTESKEDGKVLLLLATDGVKGSLSELVTSLRKREGVEAFGAVASSVTSLHTPKVFAASPAASMVKTPTGLVGLLLQGDVSLELVAARSCRPIGPALKVTESKGREILMLQGGSEAGGDTSIEPPLVQLEHVLNTLSPIEADALKRELLIGVTPISSNAGSSNSALPDGFYGQKPTTFDPFSGSITVPVLPAKSITGGVAAGGGAGYEMRFCMRDTATARQDLVKASSTLRSAVRRATTSTASPLACMLLGSMERGNKVFRLSSWEARNVFSVLQEAGAEGAEVGVPVMGLHAAGVFGVLGGGQGAMMETDALYALLGRKSAGKANASSGPASSSSSSSDASDVAVDSPDVCTASELRRYSDREDLVLVTKRDPESASPVRVATMDYVVPEKAPQPSTVLESLVWERERDVDRMRERFQLARALSLAKAAEGKYPRRDFWGHLASGGSGSNKGLIVEFYRQSFNLGRLGEAVPSKASALTANAAAIAAASTNAATFDPSAIGNAANAAAAGTAADATNHAAGQISRFAQEVCEAAAVASSGAVRVAAVGCNVDLGTFRGSYEDIEGLRKNTQGSKTLLPVLCSDFVVYAYQLFQAKASGADAVKLMAAVLSMQDLSYLIKIATTLGLQSVVVVSSKPQLLQVLSSIPGLSGLSVSSRNMRLWKLDPTKALDILTDPECLSAIHAYSAGGSGSNGKLVVLAEGLPAEAVKAVLGLEVVSAVCVGEELLGTPGGLGEMGAYSRALVQQAGL